MVACEEYLSTHSAGTHKECTNDRCASHQRDNTGKMHGMCMCTAQIDTVMRREKRTRSLLCLCRCPSKKPSACSTSMNFAWQTSGPHFNSTGAVALCSNVLWGLRFKDEGGLAFPGLWPKKFVPLRACSQQDIARSTLNSDSLQFHAHDGIQWLVYLSEQQEWIFAQQAFQ